jgi:hypothetical protein
MRKKRKSHLDLIGYSFGSFLLAVVPVLTPFVRVVLQRREAKAPRSLFQDIKLAGKALLLSDRQRTIATIDQDPIPSQHLQSAVLEEVAEEKTTTRKMGTEHRRESKQTREKSFVPSAQTHPCLQSRFAGAGNKQKMCNGL